MNAPDIHRPIIKGWCPGALRPMLSGDGLVVRIRPRAGRLTQPQSAGIANLAQACGNGLIDLSTRANIQLRGVTEASYPALIDGLRKLRLIDETVTAEAQRNIIVSPFWQSGDAAEKIAAKLATALSANTAPQLPGKFGFAIDCGARPVLRDVPADIRLERAETGELLLCAGQSPLGQNVTDDTAVNAALALAQWFISAGGVVDGRGRMQALLDQGAALPAGFDAARSGTTPDRIRPGQQAYGFLVGIEFGQMPAQTLISLAELGPLRITPWRMILIEDMQTAPALPGLITDPDNPLLRVIACTGAPGCVQAHGKTRVLARTIAPYLRDGQLLHVSGCAKGCAHPQPALTLTATPNGFDLIFHGTADATPARFGLTPDDLTVHPDLVVKAL